MTLFDNRVGRCREETAVHLMRHFTSPLGAGGRTWREILQHQAALALMRFFPLSTLVRFRLSFLGGPRSWSPIEWNLSNGHPGSLDLTGRHCSMFLAPSCCRTPHFVARS